MGTDVSYEGRDLEVLADMPNYYAWVMETFGPHLHGHVMEYGAGAGTVSQRLLPFAERLTLIEPSGNLAELLKARFGNHPRVNVATETLESHAACTEAASVDSVVLVNVLEHIEDDKAALHQLLRILKPGGHLLIFVPALRSLMSELDRSLGHYRRYHKDDLLHKISSAGGEVVLCRYFDIFGMLPWFVLNTLLGRTAFNPRLVWINDSIIVPVARAFERLLAPPVGKNLIVVVRKAEIER